MNELMLGLPSFHRHLKSGKGKKFPGEAVLAL